VVAACSAGQPLTRLTCCGPCEGGRMPLALLYVVDLDYRCTCGGCPRIHGLRWLDLAAHACRPRPAWAFALRRWRRPALPDALALLPFLLFPVLSFPASGAMPLRVTAPLGRLSSWRPAARQVCPIGHAFCFIPPPPMPVKVGSVRQCALPCSSRLRSPHYGACPSFRPPPVGGSLVGRPHGFAVLALCLFLPL
jgi:hypothetical protein